MPKHSLTSVETPTADVSDPGKLEQCAKDER